MQHESLSPADRQHSEPWGDFGYFQMSKRMLRASMIIGHLELRGPSMSSVSSSSADSVSLDSPGELEGCDKNG